MIEIVLSKIENQEASTITKKGLCEGNSLFGIDFLTFTYHIDRYEECGSVQKTNAGRRIRKHCERTI